MDTYDMSNVFGDLSELSTQMSTRMELDEGLY
ncbi:hypothetical protein CLV51_10919 [Chitinophaga niastensis]|uniref:Uncharacterized protein n=1 Tax=Chitinophaga niastensis TaxID=536980 RepID=A0A2P8H9X9_CHINA|nr:hypothetical protein CLV51_10919 [Chitinophaga niastensis]